MVQIPPWLYSSFKELSNDTSHAQIRVQTNKLCHRQVGEENFVTTKATTKLCQDKPRFCRDKASDKTLSRQSKGQNSVATNPDFVATKPVTNFIMTNSNFVATKPVTKLCRDKARDKTLPRQTHILSRQSQRHRAGHPEC